MDFESVPHVVFTHPQIAAVGLTEEQGRKSHEILVGRAMYFDTVMGEAMAEREGFAKAIVEKGSERILGFHTIGPHAAILIQEVVNAVIHSAKCEIHHRVHAHISSSFGAHNGNAGQSQIGTSRRATSSKGGAHWVPD